MVRFIVRKAISSILVVFAVATVTFFGIRLSGNDPITQELQAAGATAEQIAEARHEFGYDRPLMVQFGDFAWQALHGDLGRSVTYGDSAIGLIAERAPYTLMLAATAIAITLAIAVPLGILAAVRRGSVVDRVVVILAALGQAIPSFVIGPLLILVFAVSIAVFPVAGAESPTSIVLPAVTLALYPLARVARLLRASMLDVSRSDFVITARAKGLAERKVVRSHTLRNALLPVLTIVGLQIVGMLGGAVVVETIFGWPGLGTLAKDALANGDFALIQAIVIVVAFAVVLVNLITDLVYSIADPRIARV